MMKIALNKLLNKLIRDEKGQALILAMILMLVGSLIIAPLLGFMSTGLIAGQVFEKKMDGLYAADAGIEDALWHLLSGTLTVLEGETEILPESTINDNTVNVTVENKGEMVYKITSIASGGSSSNTTLEVYVRNDNLLNNAITSGGEVTFRPGSSANGTVVEDYDGDWPTAEQFADYFWQDVSDLTPYPSNTIDVKNNLIIGPLYRNGDLDIKNTGTAGLTAMLGGTVYVTGNMSIGTTNKDFTLNLNGQTIFVEGTIVIGGKTTITGSGAIIALGDIDFAPKMASGPDDFVFIMSVEGSIFMRPIGNFYGSLAGNTTVQLQPGSTITWNDPSGTGFNLPNGVTGTLKILAWQID